MRDCKVYIERRIPSYREVTIWAGGNNGVKDVNIGLTGDKIKSEHDPFLKVTEIEPGQMIPKDVLPLMKLPGEVYDALVQAIIKDANQRGVRTDGESVLSGKLSATQNHLDHLTAITTKLLDKVVGTKKQ